MLHPVYEFRPLPTAFRPCDEVFRFADGNWIADDGEYDLAFAGGALCLMVELPYQKNIIWSWLSGHWSEDNHRHPRSNPWHYMLRDNETEWGGAWGRDAHPNSLAGRSGMTWICGRRGGASGTHVDFNLKDKHIAAGLVRNRDTKEIVTFPDLPVCMYCGDHGPHAAIARAEDSSHV